MPKGVVEKISANLISLLLSGHSYNKDIVVEDKFRDLLKREKLRVDRNGHFFSVIIFHLNTDDKHYCEMNHLKKIIKERIRSTDTAGWLGINAVGCLLPDTPEAGAKRLSDKVFQKLGIHAKCFVRTIYSYPFRNSSSHCQFSQFNSNDSSDFKKSKTENTYIAKTDNGESSSESICQSFELLCINLWKAKRKYYPKRIFDILIASLFLLITSPIMLLMALFIKLTSKGPVFFKQKRVGFRGKLFNMFKFRTMEVATDQTIHQNYFNTIVSNNKPMIKIDKCQRLIPFGNFIRRLFIDELPQLFNVLQGNMSIVGPRPAILYEVDAYSNWHMERFQAVPGMTGSWQVSGKNRLTFDEMVRLDIRYKNEMSLWIDFKILLKTPLAIISEVIFNGNLS